MGGRRSSRLVRLIHFRHIGETSGVFNGVRELHGLRGVAGAVNPQECTMRGILLWLIGIPIPIIILLYLFNVV